MKLMKMLKMAVVLIAWGIGGDLLAADLAVFFPTTRPVKKIEKVMKSADIGDVVALAKFKDFKKIVEKDGPNYVVSSDIFTDIYGDKYDKVKSFQIGGKSSFKYLLLSTDASWKKKKLKKGKVGMIATAKRKDLKKYLAKKFGGKFKGVKTVSKAEDLFPLLVFKSVDFIVVEPYIYEELKSRFSTKVHVIKESSDVSVPSLYVKKGGDKSGAEKVSKISGADLGSIGFSGVK